jgi:phosphoenolpyruvate synthase/pyruvate phosphate dikinase
MNGLDIFKGIKLYRQSGTLGRYQLLMVARCVAELKHYLPVTYDDFFIYWKGEHADWHFQEDKMHAITKAFLAATRDGMPERWATDWRDIDGVLTEASRRIHDIDLAAFSYTELHEEYDKMFALKRAMWAASIFIDAFDLGDDLQEIAHTRERYGFSEHETQVLLTPRVPAYITLWHRALVDVRDGVRAADDVAREWFWAGTDYFYCNEMTVDVIMKESQHAQAETFVSPAAEQEQILAVHGLAQNPLALFEMLTEWRDIRKRLNFTALYALCRILKEAARRRGVPEEYVRWMTPQEAEALFTRTLTSEERHHVSEGASARMFVYVHADGTYDVSEGAEADADQASLVRLEKSEAVTEFKGTVASRGMARGAVRNVKSPDTPEARAFQEGDILVTAMTRPEFVPLMRLAAAIITDEGGITSHAAIVSRELKKPCIIGTKIATQVLKDGDMVEVDAEKGLVRRVS